MKIYGNLDLRTGDLYEDDVKTYGIVTVADDTTRDNLVDVEDGQLSVTLSDYTLNMYDSTSALWKKFNVVDPVESVTEYADSNDNITLSTGHVNVPLSNVEYTDRTSTDLLFDFYFKGAFNNWDVIARLTGTNNTENSLAVTWNEYYGLCLHVSTQDFHDTRIFPTTDAWHHLTCRQDFTNGQLDWSLDGYRIYQTPVVPLVNPTQLRLGQADTEGGFDSTSLWVSGYGGKICQLRLATDINRTYIGDSFSIYPHREIADENTEIFLQPTKGVITEDSPNLATPSVVGATTYGDDDDSPFTEEILYEVSADQHRTYFHNDNATTDLIFTLPPVEDQKIFAFVHFDTGFNIKIRCQYTERIVGTNGDNSEIDWDFIMNDEITANSIIVLKGNASNQWEITTIKGTWKHANNYA